MAETFDPASSPSREEQQKLILEALGGTTGEPYPNSAAEDQVRVYQQSLEKSVHDAYLRVAGDSLARAVTRTNLLLTAITTAATLYAALLGLVFAASGVNNRSLPHAALVPAIFLGGALGLAAIYAVGLSRIRGRKPLLRVGYSPAISVARLEDFILWCNRSALARAWALYGSLAAFAYGAITMPLPFLGLDTTTTRSIAALGCILVAAFMCIGGTVTAKVNSSRKGDLNPSGAAGEP